MYISFDNKDWLLDKLCYAYTNRFKETPLLHQENDYLFNSLNPSGSDQKYGYVSVVTKQKVTSPIKLITRFSFEGLAAPLITMVKDLRIDQNGNMRYDDYKEIVVWKNGINVWNLWKNKEKIIYDKLLALNFNVSENEIHTLEVIIEKDSFTFTLDGATTFLRIDDMYQTFHLGITACEGICKFYDLEIGELA